MLPKDAQAHTLASHLEEESVNSFISHGLRMAFFDQNFFGYKLKLRLVTQQTYNCSISKRSQVFCFWVKLSCLLKQTLCRNCQRDPFRNRGKIAEAGKNKCECICVFLKRIIPIKMCVLPFHLLWYLLRNYSGTWLFKEVSIFCQIPPPQSFQTAIDRNPATPAMNDLHCLERGESTNIYSTAKPHCAFQISKGLLGTNRLAKQQWWVLESWRIF